MFVPPDARMGCLRVFAGRSTLVASAALVAPTAAGAHIRSSVVAVDYRARVFPLAAPLRAAAAVRAYESDQALGLTVRPGHTVVVLGYTEEPFVRINGAGVAANASSPTAAAVGLLRPGSPSVGVEPVWHRLSGRRTVIWHDARELARDQERRAWAVPLVVDGRRARLEGEIWRVRAPSPWPWLSVGLPFVALTGLLLACHRRLLGSAAVVLGQRRRSELLQPQPRSHWRPAHRKGGGWRRERGRVRAGRPRRGRAWPGRRAICRGRRARSARLVGWSEQGPRVPARRRAFGVSGRVDSRVGRGHDFGGRCGHRCRVGRVLRAARVAGRILGSTRPASANVVIPGAGSPGCASSAPVRDTSGERGVCELVVCWRSFPTFVAPFPVALFGRVRAGRCSRRLPRCVVAGVAAFGNGSARRPRGRGSGGRAGQLGGWLEAGAGLPAR
jgi:hypothetical protein